MINVMIMMIFFKMFPMAGTIATWGLCIYLGWVVVKLVCKGIATLWRKFDEWCNS